ncbi:sensor histidine kinase : Histidine kinase OS=Bosea sp. LC85 GN=FG93_00154 PE=4 SV=1: PAS_8: PAS_4: PAS_4: PAS: HisKA: HATPase_c [Gemmata massiliana]|uniref:histidine kinase n=1 Tax=Gemmata massiliana TaxID=1210884 RepID=A0A6P2D2A5_9BACT|nr:PAS domain S-box protein [Gemmata massiliana]VTR94696.1 sensor histidine kinase : Histidine kinase OS=Bosea sp. LC85 GN=FG93_00154 PE=4 SV=1: PAS_8: PAS_4: PAS_4: PAS: HisKA: HATPase_c [Gemmata massiliana]
MPHTRASAGFAGLRSTAEIVLDALNEGLLTVGPGSVVRFANRRAGEQFGCAPGELVGAHIDALVPGVAPVRSDRPRADLDPLAPALGFRARARRRDGAEFPVAVALTPLPDGSVLVSVRGTAPERGALTGTEPEVDRGLIDSLDVPVVVLDRSGTVTAINRAWERVFQPYEPGADRGVASDYLDVCCRVTGPYSEEAATVERGVCAVLNGTLGRFTAECPFRVDGEIRWYQIRVAALAGRVPGATVAHWDVTDLRRTEHALRESEQRFRAVVESQTEQVCRFRSDGTLTFVNSAYCRYFGRRADELIGRPFWTLVADTDTEPVRQNLASITPEHPVATVEHRVLASNGEVRWQQWTNRGLFDAGGRLIEFQSVGRDVTDRKNSEEQTRQSEERFRDLFQNSPLATVCWRAEGDDFVLADSNEAAKNLYSDGVNQAIGWKLSEVHATRPEHRANIARCYRERVPFSAEFCWPEMPWGESSGGYAEVLVSYSFVPPNLVMSALQVVTERKQQERALRASEERLRRVLSALREGVVSVDPDGRMRTCNESAMRLFGERPDGLIGDSLTERIGLALREDGRPLSPDLFPWEVVRRTDALSAGGTFLAAPARGPFVRLMISAHALPAEPNGPRPVVVSFTDITARWHAEEQLRQHKAELAHVARCSLVGEMAAVLAHELNQPLTAVINYCRGSVLRLRAGAADVAEIVEGLNLAIGQAERAAGIVHRVREFMRKREPQRAATQINDVVQEALALVGPELRHHGIRVVPRLGAELPLIQVDRIQIEQVLLNLIRNAGEALTNLPVIERRIVIETGATGASVCVRVIDSGPGFDAEGLRRVFEPFYTTKKQGTGLGLTISRGIIESHGGRLTLAPAFPRGAGFSFTLPITSERPASGPIERAE